MFSSQDSGQKCNHGKAQPKQQQRTSSKATAIPRKWSIDPLAHWPLLSCCRPAARSALKWLVANSDAATTLQPVTDMCAAQQLADLQHVTGQNIVGDAAAWLRHECPPPLLSSARQGASRGVQCTQSPAHSTTTATPHVPGAHKHAGRKPASRAASRLTHTYSACGSVGFKAVPFSQPQRGVRLHSAAQQQPEATSALH